MRNIRDARTPRTGSVTAAQHLARQAALVIAGAVEHLTSDDGGLETDDTTLTAFQSGLNAAGHELFARPYVFLLAVIGGLADLGLGGRRP